MTDDIPPFLAGQAAYHAGRSILDNPHPPIIAEGDDYPGPWRNWRSGWKHARAMDEYTIRGNRND